MAATNHVIDTAVIFLRNSRVRDILALGVDLTEGQAIQVLEMSSMVFEDAVKLLLSED